MASVGMSAVRFWNLSDFAHYVAPLDLPLPDWGRSAAFYPDGTGVLVSTNSGLWQTSITDQAGYQVLPDGSVVRQRLVQPTLTKPLDLPTLGDGKIQCSADGRRVAVAQYRQQPRLVNLDVPGHVTVLTSAPSTTAYISISHDGKWVATGTWGAAGDTHVTVCDAQTGQRVRDLPVRYDANVAFSPDNRWLVTCTCQEYRFWEVGSWEPRHGVTRDANIIGGIAFSPDSRTVAVSPGRYGVRLIDADTGADIVTLEDFGEEMPVGFSPDGGQLATFRLNETMSIRLWDIRRIRQELAEMGLDWPAPPLPPRPNTPRIDLSLAPPAP
jgi:WD40 repeat protein